MKRIKMLTLAAGPAGAMHPGKTYPVDDKTAKMLVDGRLDVYKRQILSLPGAMGYHSGIACTLCHLYRIQSLGKRTNLVDLDKH